MKKLIPVLFIALISGCATSSGPDTKTTAAAKPQAAPAAMSAEAAKAISQAQADVKAANSHDALWIPAKVDLKKAEEAAAKGDNAAAIKQAKQASEMAQLGIQQLKYPLTAMPK
ncbi:MAG: hypothetical protein K8F27_13070 [Sulfuricellaceae bacterium]|nr:hypothetical protein [Sulfuricellaceae bacterium]